MRTVVQRSTNLGIDKYQQTVSLLQTCAFFLITKVLLSVLRIETFGCLSASPPKPFDGMAGVRETKLESVDEPGARHWDPSNYPSEGGEATDGRYSRRKQGANVSRKTGSRDGPVRGRPEYP